MNKYKSRKFLLSLLVILLGAGMVFAGVADTVIMAFAVLSSPVVGLYSYHNVKDNDNE